MRTTVIQAVGALLILVAVVSAQEQPPELKKTPSVSGPANTQPLALEIHYIPTLPPAYLKIEGAEVKPQWIWFSRFSTMPGWQLPQGAQRINAVRVTSKWNSETAEVRVTLLRGLKFYDEEEEVSSYKTGLNDPRVITELASYGIEPFKITLISPKPATPPPPGLENRTSSIEIVKVEGESLPLPAYRVTFRNLSSKNLVALRLHDYRGGLGPGSVMFQGEDGRPLIESNGTLTKLISANLTEKIGDSYAPGAGAFHTLIVNTAVFNDGTFEGDLESACMYEQFVFGRKAWLKSVLKLIEEQLTNSNDPEAPAQLKQKISALRYVRTDVDRLLGSVVSPQCTSPAGYVEGVFSGENRKLINDLEIITTTRPKPLVTFGAWLESTRQRFRQWLGNLNEFPTPRPQ